LLPSLRRGREAWEVLLDSLARWYTHGGAVDWAALDQGQPRRRLALPTYPFQRQRFWAVAKPEHQPTSASLPKAGEREAAHPLLGLRLRSASRDTLFESRLSGREPEWLKDHCIYGRSVLPAAAYLEMALAAATSKGGNGPCVLEEVVFHQLLPLPEDAEQIVQLVMTPGAAGEASFQIVRLAADAQSVDAWLVNASGKVSRGAARRPAGRSDRIDLEQARARSREGMAISDYYHRLQRNGLEHGPRFQGLQELWRSNGSTLSRIQLPESSRDDARHYRLHPVLLDTCLQAVGALTATEDLSQEELYLPFAIDRMHWSGATPNSHLWCEVRQRDDSRREGDALTVNLRLFDSVGEVVVDMDGLRLRRTTKATLLRLVGQHQAPWSYQVAWPVRPRHQRQQSAPPSTAKPRRHWLVLADHGGVGDGLAEELRRRGDRCVVARPGDGYIRRGEDSFELAPAEPEQFRRVLREAPLAGQASWDGVIHLLSLDLPDLEKSALDDLEASALQSCGSALHLIQALQPTLASRAPQLWLVTRGAQPAAESAGSSPIQACLWGLGRTLTLEHPEFQCTCFDLDPAAPLVIADLVEEILDPNSEDQVAWRDGRRHVARLVPGKLADPDKPFRASPKGSYLITGGLGGLGLRVAGRLVELGARHLVLLGRRGPAPAAQESLARWQAHGVDVHVAQADVADAAALAGVLAEMSGPPLRGVVHAAGELDDGVLLQLDWGRFERVLAAKVRGAWLLHTLTRDRDLDFFVLFSSAAALLGSPGQANHAAANAFLDALAHYRRGQGLPALSINWGAWSETGKAAALNAGDRFAKIGIDWITPERGLEALAQMIQLGWTQGAVLPINPSRFAAHLAKSNFRPFLSELSLETTAHETGGLSPGWRALVNLLEQTPADQRLGAVQGYLQQQAAQVMGLEAAQAIDLRQPLNELGLDSLMAVEFRNVLNLAVGRNLPATLLFNYPTLEALALYLARDVLALELTEEGRPQVRRESRVVQMTSQIENLSDDEAEELLDLELAALEEEERT
jgi:acyl transferase domain-containing protein